MRDQFDVDLEDSDLLGEVELTTALMIAATESVERLSCAEIDDLLGVTPVVPEAGPRPAGPVTRVGRRTQQDDRTSVR